MQILLRGISKKIEIFYLSFAEASITEEPGAVVPYAGSERGSLVNGFSTATMK